MSTRRSTAAALLLALLVAAALVAPPGASAAEQRGDTTTLRVPAGDRIVGERADVTGTVPGSRARPVTVQLRGDAGTYQEPA